MKKIALALLLIAVGYFAGFYTGIHTDGMAPAMVVTIEYPDGSGFTRTMPYNDSSMSTLDEFADTGLVAKISAFVGSEQVYRMDAK